MMYRYHQKSQTIHITFSDGGIGDDIARLPVIPYILELHQHISINLWVKSYFKSVAQRSLPKSPRLKIFTFDDSKKADLSLPVRKFDGFPYTNLGSHMTEHAFHVICNTSPESKYLNYLPINLKSISVKRFNLPEKYIVIPTGYTAKVRQMKTSIVSEITDYILSKGYTPVFLGKKETAENSNKSKVIKADFDADLDSVFDKGLNLIEKTTLLETSLIIKQSCGIIGLDNGLLHIAGTTDIPIIGGYTTVNPEDRMPYRNGMKGWNYYPVVLTEEELPCRFCQSSWSFTFGLDFRECYYEDYKCVDMLVASKYIEQLEKIL